MTGVLDTLCDKVCQWLATGQWFSPGTLVFPPISTNDQPDLSPFLKIKLLIGSVCINKY
jgi:hypothetical protein